MYIIISCKIHVVNAIYPMYGNVKRYKLFFSACFIVYLVEAWLIPFYKTQPRFHHTHTLGLRGSSTMLSESYHWSDEQRRCLLRSIYSYRLAEMKVYIGHNQRSNVLDRCVELRTQGLCKCIRAVFQFHQVGLD